MTDRNPLPHSARGPEWVAANSTFDLYSMGVDVGSAPRFTSGTGQDDIARAGDGGFVGPAEHYSLREST